MLLKNSNNYKIITAAFTWNFLKIQCHFSATTNFKIFGPMCYLKQKWKQKYYCNFHMEIFLLLETFETFEKMSKIKTIKNIFMNSSDVLLKNSDTSKHIAVFTWKSLKIGCSSFTVIWTKLLSSKLLNYHSFNLKLLES